MAETLARSNRRTAGKHRPGGKPHVRIAPHPEPWPPRPLDVFQFLDKSSDTLSDSPSISNDSRASTLADDDSHHSPPSGGGAKDACDSVDMLRQQIQVYEAHLAASRAVDRARAGVPGALEPYMEIDAESDTRAEDDDDAQLATWTAPSVPRAMATHSPASPFLGSCGADGTSRALERARPLLATTAPPLTGVARPDPVPSARTQMGHGREPQPDLVCRRFARLQERVLVHLQQELQELDEELVWVDERVQAIQQQPHGPTIFSQALSKLEFQRTDVLARVFAKLNQYNQALGVYQKQHAKASHSTAADVERYRAHMRKTCPDEAVGFLDHASDLMAVPTARRETGAGQANEAQASVVTGAMLGAGGVLVGFVIAMLAALVVH